MITGCSACVHTIDGCIPVFLCACGEEFIMDHIDCILDAAALDEAGDTDFGGTDDLDVDLGMG